MKTSNKDYTRFDLPVPFGVFIDKAIELDLVDGRDIVVLVVKYGDEYDKIVTEIVEYAYARIHCDYTHGLIVPYADKFFEQYNAE